MVHKTSAIAIATAKTQAVARTAITMIMLAILTLPAMAQQAQNIQQHRHDHHAAQAAAPLPAFVASTAKPFSSLMNDAMSVMDDGMRRAPMDGVAEHDFVTMMIPHHQGAIDMAKAVLLYSTDPELRNLAQGIITEQQNEIRIMQAWLQRYHANQSGKSGPAKQGGASANSQ